MGVEWNMGGGGRGRRSGVRDFLQSCNGLALTPISASFCGYWMDYHAHVISHACHYYCTHIHHHGFLCHGERT